MSESNAVPRGWLELARGSTVSKLGFKRPTEAGLRGPNPQASLQKPQPIALLIPEIVLMIFGYLDSLALARSAQVCRLWSDIAPDFLWKDLPTLLPLLNLYGLQPIKRRFRGNGSHILREEWDFGSSDPQIPTKRQQELYLPRVRSLQHDLYRADSPKPKPTVRTHTLQKLSQIKLRLPNLESLHFKTGDESGDDFLAAIPFIMPTLKSLTLPTVPMAPEDSCPELRQLIDTILNTPGLSLEYLDASGITMHEDAIIEALGSLVRQQTSLQHLGVQLSKTELLTTACNKWREHPSISSLKIKFPLMAPFNHLDDWVPALSRFRGLKALELTIDRLGINTEERDITDIVASWPTLQQLRLTGFETAPALLVSIAHSLPWLDTLEITLRWVHSDAWPQVMDTIPRLTQLKELYLRADPDEGMWGYVSSLEMSEVRTLSQLIFAICPNESELILRPCNCEYIEYGEVRESCTSPRVIEDVVREYFGKGRW